MRRAGRVVAAGSCVGPDGFLVMLHVEGLGAGASAAGRYQKTGVTLLEAKEA